MPLRVGGDGGIVVAMHLEDIQSAITAHGPGPMQVLVVGEGFVIPMYAGCAVYSESEGSYPILNFNVWKHHGPPLEPVPENLQFLRTVATRGIEALSSALADVARNSEPADLETNLALTLSGWALSL